MPTASDAHEASRPRIPALRRAERKSSLSLFAGCGVDGEELFQEGFELVEVEGVGAVGPGVGGVVVDFEEDAVDAGGDGRAREDGDEFRLTAGDSVGGGGCLDGMSAVEDYGRERAHDGQRAHIDDEIVIAETGTALGERDARVAGGGHLLDSVAHVFGGDELTLFHIDGTAGFAGGDQQIGLSAEKSGNLEDVAGFGDLRAVCGLVYIGEDGEMCVFGDAAQDARAFGEAGSAEAGDRGAVGLVVGGLEDVWHAEIAGDALDGIGHHAGVLLALDDAGAGDKKELAAADRDGADFEVVLRHWRQDTRSGSASEQVPDAATGEFVVSALRHAQKWSPNGEAAMPC